MEYEKFGAYRECAGEPTGEQLESMKKEIALELAERIMQARFIIKPFEDGKWTVGTIIQIPDACKELQ